MGKKEEEIFKPYVIKCENVSKELKKASKQNKVPLSQVDFDILSFSTYIKTTDKQEEEEWTEADKEIMKKFQNEKFLLLDDLRIMQIYQIRVRPAKPEKDKLDIVLTGNKIFTKVSVIFKNSSQIEYTPELFTYLVDFLNKKKVRFGLLIGIFDETMRSDLKELVSKIKEEKELKEDFKVSLCKCIDPIQPIDDSISHHYKEKVKKEDEHGRVDHSQRDFVYPVSNGEVLIEYTKPKSGRPGRNCKGEHVPVDEPNQKHLDELKFSHTAYIEKIENDESILFIAKKNGYVDVDGSSYDIKEDLEVNEINFKETGSIDAGADSDIKINVKESDSMKDAIGSGVKVNVSEANVEGNVGEGAEIRGGNIKIGGQTHLSSIIDAENVEVNIHKGFAKGKTVKITRLEGGKVEGEVVRVSEAGGGEIRAKEIYIDTLKSHTTLKASRLIHLNKVKGDENKLIIDPLALSNDENLIKNIINSIDRLSSDVEKANKDLAKKSEDAHTMKRAADIVKSRISQAKSSGKKPEIGDVMKIREYNSMIQDLKHLQEQVKEKNDRIEKFKSDLAKIDAAVLDAKIINVESWDGFNNVKFVLVSSNQEIDYSPRGMEKEIYLEKEGKHYKVVTV